MKFVPAQLTAFLTQRGARRDLRGLFRYLLLLGLIVGAYTAIFHVLMLQEGQQHSWLTGFYWTLTVMSTLGFGDITFHGDLGRVFSLLVLLTGIVMLLIMLPFVFIRHFYAPWLEAQIRTRAPREAPEDTAGHVILCRYDEIAAALIPKLEELGIELLDAKDSFRFEQGFSFELHTSEDSQEARDAFVEKRDAKFDDQ